MDVKRINSWSEAEAREALLRCCGASRWVTWATSRRPFASEAELLAAAEAGWEHFTRQDWLEAFAAHPKIGDLESPGEKGDCPFKERGEQSGMAGASDAVLSELAEGNHQYEKRFGHIFIVCATGKTAEEMLALLQARLHNDPETELLVAAEEQKKITYLRLRKLCP